MDEEVRYQCIKIVNDLIKHKNSEPFRNPVPWRESELFDYPKIIKKPMDLSTVAKNLERSEYKTINDFSADVRLIWTNCMIYNKEDSELYKIAKHLQNLFEQKLRKVPGSDLLQDATLEEKAQFADNLSQVTPEDVGKIVTILYERCKASISKLSATDIYVNLDEVDIETFRCIQSYAKSLVQPSVETTTITHSTPVLTSSATLSSPTQILSSNNNSNNVNINVPPNITPEKQQIHPIQQQIETTKDVVVSPTVNTESNTAAMEIESPVVEKSTTTVEEEGKKTVKENDLAVVKPTEEKEESNQEKQIESLPPPPPPQQDEQQQQQQLNEEIIPAKKVEEAEKKDNKEEEEKQDKESNMNYSVNSDTVTTTNATTTTVSLPQEQQTPVRPEVSKSIVSPPLPVEDNLPPPPPPTPLPPLPSTLTPPPPPPVQPLTTTTTTPFELTNQSNISQPPPPPPPSSTQFPTATEPLVTLPVSNTFENAEKRKIGDDSTNENVAKKPRLD